MHNRTHRPKINECFSEIFRIEYDVLQCLTLDSLLFNVVLIYFFYKCEESNIASYAVDTTPYSCEMNTQIMVLN